MNMTPTTDKHFSPDNPSQHHDDQNDEFEDKNRSGIRTFVRKIETIVQRIKVRRRK